MEKLLVRLSKKMSKISLRTIWGLLAIIIIPILLVPFFRDGSTLNCIGRFLVDVFSPVSMRNVPYGNPCCDGANDLGFASALAYAVGIILISGIVIPIVTNYLRSLGDRYLNGTLDKYGWKDHVLFLGFDEMMLGTLRKVLACGQKVVVAVPDGVRILRIRLAGMLAGEELERVEVVQCNMSDCKDLEKRARVKHSCRIFIIGQPDDATHDAVNLKCLGLVAAMNPKLQSGRSVPCMYYLRNQSTFYLIHRLNYEAGNFRKGIEAAKLPYDKDIVGNFIKASEPFNFHESMARHVLFGANEQGNDILQLNASSGNPHLVIYGMTPMGIALMRDVLITQHFPGRRLRITMVDDNAKEEMHYLIGRHRPFFENCHYTFCDLDDPAQEDEHKALLNFIDVDMEFVKGDVAHPRMVEYLRDCVKKEGDSLTIAVCTNDSPKNVALSLYMPRQVFEAKVSIWVYQTGANGMKAFVENDLGRDRYGNIRIFSSEHYGVSDRTSSWQWQLAKTVGDKYAENHPSGEKYSWEYSQPKDRWSSLYGAISKIAMLRSIGKDRTPILLTPKEKGSLSETEHNRWNTEKLLNGWEPAVPGEGKTLFTHDKIIPYEELDKESKDKDLEQIEAVIEYLNRKGKERNS